MHLFTKGARMILAPFMSMDKRQAAEFEARLAEADDRGVFGTSGLTRISASVRKKFQTSLEPASVRAWKMLRSNDEASLPEAEKLLQESMPRNEEDLRDDRYFGIYWGLGEVAVRKNDLTLALLRYEEAIRTFPSALRKSHIQRLEEMGILAASSVLQSNVRTSETDAAAIAMRALKAIADYRESGAGTRIRHMQASLEHNGPSRNATRPSFPRTRLA